MGLLGRQKQHSGSKAVLVAEARWQRWQSSGSSAAAVRRRRAARWHHQRHKGGSNSAVVELVAVAAAQRQKAAGPQGVRTATAVGVTAGWRQRW